MKKKKKKKTQLILVSSHVRNWFRLSRPLAFSIQESKSFQRTWPSSPERIQEEEEEELRFSYSTARIGHCARA